MDRVSNTQVCDGDVLRWDGIVFSVPESTQHFPFHIR